MLKFFNKEGRFIGYTKSCNYFNHNDKLLGTTKVIDGNLYLYTPDGILTAYYNGIYTYDKQNNIIEKGNLIYKIVYPSFAGIR